MKITFVLGYANLAGGIRVVALHAQGLAQRGHEVVVVSRPHRRPRLGETVRALASGRGWPDYQRVSPSHLDGLAIEHRVLPRTRAVRARDVPDADVIVATWWETADWVAALPPRKGAKVYFVQHHEVFDNQPAERVAATWRLPMQKVAVSQWLVDLARERYGDGSAILVPNTVDHGLFDAPPRGRQAVPTVGTMYSTHRFKGCATVLRAVELARRQLPALRLVAFGEEQPVPGLPLPPGTDYVRAPAQDALPALYGRCDAWLFGSTSEGFGLPILEAMACRTPVIGTPAGAAPEMLADGRGRLVAFDDPVDMARSIVEVCQLPDGDWRRLSDGARQATEGYTWDDATARFEAALVQARVAARRGVHGLPVPRAWQDRH